MMASGILLCFVFKILTADFFKNLVIQKLQRIWYYACLTLCLVFTQKLHINYIHCMKYHSSYNSIYFILKCLYELHTLLHYLYNT